MDRFNTAFGNAMRAGLHIMAFLLIWSPSSASGAQPQDQRAFFVGMRGAIRFPSHNFYRFPRMGRMSFDKAPPWLKVLPASQLGPVVISSGGTYNFQLEFRIVDGFVSGKDIDIELATYYSNPDGSNTSTTTCHLLSTNGFITHKRVCDEKKEQELGQGGILFGHELPWRSTEPALPGVPDDKAARQLLQRYATETREAREKTLESMGRLGPAAFQELIKALKSEDAGVRSAVLSAINAGAGFHVGAEAMIDPLIHIPYKTDFSEYTLADFGPRIVPALKQAYRTGNPVVRERAIATLYRLGPASSEAPDELVEALLDTATYTTARFALTEFVQARAAPQLRAAWAQAPRRERLILLEILREVDPSTTTAHLLVDAIDDQDKWVPSSAVWQLLKIPQFSGDAAEFAIPRLVQLVVENEGNNLASDASKLLGQIGPKAIPQLIVELRRDPPPAFGRFFGPETALAAIGPPAVPELLKVLKDGAPNAKALSAKALGQIRPTSEQTVSALRSALPSAEPQVKFEILQAFEHLGPSGGSAVDDLEKQLSSDDWAARRDAATALGKMGPAAMKAVPSLIRLLSDPKPEQNNWNVRWAAIGALGNLHAIKAIPALRNSLNHDERARYSAAEALGQLGAKAKPAVPDLIKCLDDGSSREACIKALGSIGAGAAAAVPRLTEFLTKPDGSICHLGPAAIVGRIPFFGCGYFATIALGEIGPPSAAAVPVLIDALEDKHGSNLVTAAPEDRPVAKHSFLTRPNWEFDEKYARKALVESLSKIGTPSAIAAARRNQAALAVP